jgi:DNA-binding NtrC family response regulator
MTHVSELQSIEQRLVGESAAMAAVRRTILRAASTESAVLISGERGTGKKRVAELLHAYGTRGAGRLVTVECADTSPEHLDAELFGAATRPGALERAEGGTLLLEDVTDLPLDLQARLVNVLDAGNLCAADGLDRPIDVRVIATTRHSPIGEVEAGRLREDLYYRLSVVPIRLAPLRARGEGDVRLLADHFLAVLNRRHGTDKRISEAMRARFAQNPWPGNVRQLRNLIERAFVLCDDTLDAAEGDFAGAPASDRHPSEIGSARTTDPLLITLPIGSSLDEIERTFIVATLEHFGGDKRRAASALGCSVKTLYNKLHLYRRQVGGPVVAAS